MHEDNPEPSEQPPFDPRAYRSLQGRDRLGTLSWYLVAAGIIALVFAALCLLLDRTGNREFFYHRDFALNPRVLGRGLLLFGIASYAAGRAIAYWRRFAKRKRD